MGNSYDDAKYGVVQRKWFRLTKKFGGDSALGIDATDWGTTDATSATLVTSWYPRGPIKMLKFGSMVLKAITNATSDLFPAYLKTRGASASAGATCYMKDTSTAEAAGHINSTTTFTVSQCKSGEYIYIRSGTPKTDKGTAANTATVTGTVALFIDYIPLYGSQWDT